MVRLGPDARAVPASAGWRLPGARQETLLRVVCGRGRNPTLRSSTCSAGVEVAALRFRWRCSTCATRSASATSGWRGRGATAISERRCCRLPPSLMPIRSSATPATTPCGWPWRAGLPSPTPACRCPACRVDAGYLTGDVKRQVNRRRWWIPTVGRAGEGKPIARRMSSTSGRPVHAGCRRRQGLVDRQGAGRQRAPPDDHRPTDDRPALRRRSVDRRRG